MQHTYSSEISGTFNHTHNAAFQRSLLRSSLWLLVGGFSLLAAVYMTGCRTTEGLGRDVEALGDNVADSAHENKP